jgi:hypothetical protein
LSSAPVRPDRRRGPGRVTTLHQGPSVDNTDTDSITVAHPGDAAGELAAWGAAVEQLHAAGLPAAVPPFPAAWLRRRGVRPDWTAAA